MRVARYVRASMHRSLYGKTFTPPARPPNVSTGHWNQATVVHLASGDVSLTVNDIANELRDQYGLFATDGSNRIPIAIRFMAITFWNLNIVTIGNSQLIINNLVDFKEMNRLTCLPADNQWARVGYQYPTSQQFIQRNHDDTNVVFKIDVRSDKWVVHISTLWRPLNGESYGNVTRRQIDSLSSELEDFSLCDIQSPHLHQAARSRRTSF